MLRINLYNLYYDGLSLIRNNKGKLLILILICLFGIGLGIGGALSVTNSNEIIRINNINIVLLINGSKSIFGYFLSRLISVALIFFLITVCSYKFLTTFISAGALFAFCFICARSLTLVFLVVKLIFLPAALICFIPCLLCFMFIFTLFILYTMEKSREFSYYNTGNYLYCVSSVFKVCYIPALPLLFICILETGLASVLTIGIVI